MAFDHLRDCSEVYERRGANSPTNRLCCAVRYHIVALLSLRALDCDVGFADRRTRTFHDHLEVMNHGFHFAGRLGLGRQDDAWIVDVYGTVGESVSSLLQNAHRLAHLLESHQVAIVHVAVRADRDLEIISLVIEIWKIFAYIVVDARCSEHWT